MREGESGSEKESEEEKEKKEKRPKRMTSKPVLEGEDYIKLKARLKERKEMLKKMPNFSLKGPGEEASVELMEDLRVPLLAGDLQNLLMYFMIGDRTPWHSHR